MTQHFIGGRPVPAIGQGTWNVEADSNASAEALRRGLDLGLTHIDTAELYGEGASERVVAKAIKGRRQEVFLVSKVHPSNAGYEGTLKACEGSLQNLGTDYLDVYLLHWRGSIPLEETFRGFARLKEQGKIKAFGVSNFDVDDLEEAAGIVDARQIVCNQVLYHLQERTVEARVQPWCSEHGIAVVAYSPFGQENFPKESSAGGKVLAKIGAAHGKTPRQVALSFLLRSKDVLTIPKSGQVPHTEENAGALGFELSPDEVVEIDAAFPLKAKKSLPTL